MAKSLQCICNSEINKSNMINASKEYKRTIKQCVNKYKHNYKKKLRSMNSNSPKDYWKYLNSLSSKSKDTHLDMNRFFNFF